MSNSAILRVLGYIIFLWWAWFVVAFVIVGIVGAWGLLAYGVHGILLVAFLWFERKMT